MSELIRRVLSVGAAPAHEEVDDPVTPTVLRYRVLLAAIALYLLWRRHTAPAISLARPWGPRWLAALTGLAFSELLRVVGRIPVATLKPPSKGVDDSKQHVVVWHPHGALTTMAFMHCGYHSVMKQPLTWFPGIAPVLFNVPFLRETTLLLNARAVSGKVMEKLASAGLNVGVQPGGIPEQLQARPVSYDPSTGPLTSRLTHLPPTSATPHDLHRDPKLRTRLPLRPHSRTTGAKLPSSRPISGLCVWPCATVPPCSPLTSLARTR
jgi:hypothetical protein